MPKVNLNYYGNSYSNVSKMLYFQDDDGTIIDSGSPPQGKKRHLVMAILNHYPFTVTNSLNKWTWSNVTKGDIQLIQGLIKLTGTRARTPNNLSDPYSLTLEQLRERLYPFLIANNL
jgi:hypothetical protein